MLLIKNGFVKTMAGADLKNGAVLIDDNGKILCVAESIEETADMTVIELVRMIPQAVSTLELDLPKNDDIVLDGPFDRPDEYYLRRQRIAFGPDAEA